MRKVPTKLWHSAASMQMLSTHAIQSCGVVEQVAALQAYHSYAYLCEGLVKQVLHRR